MRISDWSSDVCSSDLLQVPAHATGVEPVAQPVVEDGDAVEVAFHAVERQCLQSRLGEQRPRRPVELRIDLAEQGEQRLAQRNGQRAYPQLLVVVPAGAAVAGEGQTRRW